MILSNDEMRRFDFQGQSYPLRCDLLVLEKIQERVGDILDADYKIRGFIPRVDADGVIDTTTGRKTFPDIGLVCAALVWMMQEAKDVTGGVYDIPTTKDLKQQDDYTLGELSLIVYKEFADCLSGKKKTNQETKSLTDTENQEKNA